MLGDIGDLSDAITVRVRLSTTYALHNLRNRAELVDLLHSFID